MNKPICVRGRRLTADFSEDRYFVDVEAVKEVRPTEVGVPAFPSTVSILIKKVRINKEDVERIARAYDGLQYMTKFLNGKEICSHCCHYPYPEEEPECTCWQDEEKEEA